jgi:hypothetical protein
MNTFDLDGIKSFLRQDARQSVCRIGFNVVQYRQWRGTRQSADGLPSGVTRRSSQRDNLFERAFRRQAAWLLPGLADFHKCHACAFGQLPGKVKIAEPVSGIKRPQFMSREIEYSHSLGFVLAGGPILSNAAAMRSALAPTTINKTIPFFGENYAV